MTGQEKGYHLIQVTA